MEDRKVVKISVIGFFGTVGVGTVKILKRERNEKELKVAIQIAKIADKDWEEKGR